MDETTDTRVVARKGFFPVVVGRDVEVRQAGAAVFVARRNLTLREGGGQWLVALGDQTIDRGGGAALISRQAQLTHGFVGLLVSGRTALAGNARVFVNVPLATAAAAAAGFAAGFFAGAVRGASRRSPRPREETPAAPGSSSRRMA